MKGCSILLLWGLIISPGWSARPLVIYGEDHRIEVAAASPQMQQLARSVLTMVANENILHQEGGAINLRQRSLRQMLSAGKSMNFCSEEKFIDQPNAGSCSGFLIAPDLILTAGHCAMPANFCSNNSWVFDFKLNETGQAGLNVNAGDIYGCKRIITSDVDLTAGVDYAIVQLDRLVTNRGPLALQKKSLIADATSLTVIGSPMGLPLKVAGGAQVRGNNHPKHFTANLDAFEGNSGAPVFNTLTGEVEGILVWGEEDFIPNLESMCLESKRCEDDECRGETVIRLNAIPELALQEELFSAVGKNDLLAIKQILDSGIWVDIYGQDRQSGLIKAALAGHLPVAQLLLENDANASLQDLTGSSALHYLSRNAEGVRLLLKYDSELELRNNNSETPIFSAIRAHSLAGLEALIRAGASLTVKNKQGLDPLKLARILKFKKGHQLLKKAGRARPKTI